MNCEATAEVKKIIRGMAKAKLESGMTDALDIVDSIHAAINEHTPLWKNEIADIIAGIGEKRKATKTELQERLTQLRKDLKAKFHPADEAKNAARQKAIRASIAKIDAQIKSGDFSKTERAKPQYDETTRRLQAELEHARARADREVAKLEYKSQSKFYRAVTLVNALYRASILTGLSVFEHLAGASLWRAASTVVEDVAGAGLRHIPGIRDIDAAALLEGGGFQGRGQLEGFKRVFSKETLKAMRDKMVRGQSDRAVMYGKEKPWSNHPLLDAVGHAHDVVKTPLEQLAYGRAAHRITNNLRRQLAREGKTPAEIDRVMVSDSALAMINGKAYEASLAAKLQGKNAFVDWYNNGLKALDRSGDVGAFLSGVARLETPIIKIPLNYAAEIASYVGGAPLARSKFNAATREAHAQFKASDRTHADRAAFEAAKKKAITPEVADYIMRNLKKQTVGAGLFLTGVFAQQLFGGLYRYGKKQPNPDVELGGLAIPGAHVIKGAVKSLYGDTSPTDDTISHHWAHSPAAGIMQMGAMTAYIMDEDRAKAEDKGDDYGHAEQLGAALDGFGQASMAILLDVPVFQIPKDLEKLSRGGNSAAKLGGEKVGAFVPGFVQWYARRQDVDESGEPIKRKPAGFTDAIKQGIPGFREEVPEK